MPTELLELPPLTTDAGVLARLLIAENAKRIPTGPPPYPDYYQNVFSSMWSMTSVIFNRRHHHPEQFGAPHAANYTDIITAPGQFQGFSKDAAGKVVISPDVQQRIDGVLRMANTGSYPSHECVDAAIQNADDIQHTDTFENITNINGVPVEGGTYGWRSENASDPGGIFIAIPASMGGVIEGNKFYTVMKFVDLPDITTDAGVLTRLLIAHCRTPAHPNYNPTEIINCMLAMRWAVHNRRWNHHPEQFGVPYAFNYIDIITAPGQFSGFSKDASGKVVISTKVQSRIDDALKTANTGTSQKFRGFVTFAIDIGNQDWGDMNCRPDRDPYCRIEQIGNIPVTGCTYGWSQENSAEPGGRLIAIPAPGGVIQGTQFYTLRKE